MSMTTTAKTPEEIAGTLWNVFNRPNVESLAAEIRAYGEQCRQEALSLSIPKEPTKLERVARALGDVAIPHKDKSFVDVARVAIEALKVDGRHNVVIGDGRPDAFMAPGWVLNRWLDSILNEGKS